MLGLSWSKKLGHISRMLNKFVRTFFIRSIYFGYRVVLPGIVLCVLVSLGSFNEAIAVDRPKIMSENHNVNGDFFNSPGFYLLTKRPVGISGKVIEFFSAVSPQSEPVTKKKPEKESDEAYCCVINYVVKHWWSLILWFFAGMFCSG